MCLQFQPTMLQRYENSTIWGTTFPYFWRKFLSLRQGCTENAPHGLKILRRSFNRRVLQFRSKFELVFLLLLRMREFVLAINESRSSVFNPNRTTFFNLHKKNHWALFHPCCWVWLRYSFNEVNTNARKSFLNYCSCRYMRKSAIFELTVCKTQGFCDNLRVFQIFISTI